MASQHQLSEMLERLKLMKFSRNDAAEAIQGQRIPPALGLPLLRICTIRGIRYHQGFGHELRGVSAEFTRALNARQIMSDHVPEDMDPEGDETPYCIWYPEVASESTYRELVKKYPHMAYQVGRGCAVAGYTDLYKELEILPEVHIAEEAREAGNMAIYDHIMAAPIKYNVMNDYCRTISATPEPGHLNGDTAVRATLDMMKQGFTYATVPEVIDGESWFNPMHDSHGYSTSLFNITEDENVEATFYVDQTEIVDKMRKDISHSDRLIKLMTNPLPLDLPTLDKDLLICMAAYHGDIDRYARLRRPRMVIGEADCCVRGIYNNTMFAVWWSTRKLPDEDPHHLSQAICARFIMNNVLSKVPNPPYGLPYLIWYPTIAQSSTYRKLAKMAPQSLPSVVRACIVADYDDLFDELIAKIEPDDALLKEAAESANPHYRQALAARVEAVGKKAIPEWDSWKLQTHPTLQCSKNFMRSVVGLASPGTGVESLYNGSDCDASAMLLMACLPKEWQYRETFPNEPKELDYEQWPPEKQSG